MGASMTFSGALGPFDYTHTFSREDGHRILWHRSPVGAAVRCRAPHARLMHVSKVRDDGTLDCADGEHLERGYFPVDLEYAGEQP